MNVQPFDVFVSTLQKLVINATSEEEALQIVTQQVREQLGPREIFDVWVAKSGDEYVKHEGM